METKSALGKRINVHSNFWRDIEPPGFICQTYSILSKRQEEVQNVIVTFGDLLFFC